VSWPPRTQIESEHLELSMTITASEAITALERGADLQNIKSVLDVGGGDGTIPPCARCSCTQGARRVESGWISRDL
jgi:hypothetical protein